jgi:predicted RNase H-like HicB family nuclease
MIKIKAFIETGKDGTYGVYFDLNEKRLNYGVIGSGNTIEEALDDFYGCYEDMKKSFENDNQYFQEAEFEFYYDTASFPSVHNFVNAPSQVQFV